MRARLAASVVLLALLVAVAELGSGSDSVASTTCWPAVNPLVIWVHWSPTTPIWTATSCVVLPSSRVTVCRPPVVRTAELGTAMPEAVPVTIPTVPMAPFVSDGASAGNVTITL
jgi:hypothetical protein